MSRGVESIDEFKGIAKDVRPAKLPAQLFQEDVGGDRYYRGVWRRRRGMRHTDQAKFSNPVLGIIGMDAPGSDYPVMFIEGTNLQGFSNVATQDDTSDEGGFGETEFGEGGFGE